MLVKVLVRLVLLAAAIGLTSWLLPGVDVDGGFVTYLWVALIFAVVNAILGPILHLLSAPLTVVTLGLFALVVNAALLGITASLSQDLSIDGFLTAVVAAVLIAVFSTIMNFFVAD